MLSNDAEAEVDAVFTDECCVIDQTAVRPGRQRRPPMR